MKKQQGFTLIELMIVVAIIGVLSAIAIPAYKDYVRKSEASSALATLKALVTPAELYIQENGALTAAIADIGTSEKANSLGDLASTIGNGTTDNTLTFTFNDTSSLLGSIMTLARSQNDGWSCGATKPTTGDFPKIDGCVASSSGGGGSDAAATF
ncbi:prepilin-type N-terminal cleavage/methylation domain-containing protein [Photobacterium carnosum]|uniref:pilin n=1 Tax=Photobacterium carnosum TaxID=2023717 RepID=UPI001E50EA56|nr:pilin [Photobacterium carnosum]MCD9522538.1 prepilin-type N-terminal cleavage/methylation domain-containing protein [Photobacterium carnosum]